MASTNGLPVPALSSANNPPADFLALANAVDAAYGGSVANWAALPATGNFAGKKLWVTDIKVVATWNGTAWVQALPVSSTGISAADKASTHDSLGVGLVNVVPASVAQSGGSASASDLGLVTFTGVTSVSLNNVFSADYENYKVIINLTAATVSGNLYYRARRAGTDLSGATVYNAGLIYLNVSTGSIGNSSQNGASFVNIGYFRGGFAGDFGAVVDVTNAYSTVASKLFFNSQGGTAAPAGIHAVNGTGRYNPGTEHDGFTIYPSASGNMTGTVQVFGYNS